MFKRIKNINIKAKIFQIIKKIQDSNLIGLLKIQFDKFIVCLLYTSDAADES